MRFKISKLVSRHVAWAIPTLGILAGSCLGMGTSAAATTGVAPNEVLVQLPLAGGKTVSAQGLSILSTAVPGAKVLRTFPHVGWELVQVPASTGHINASTALTAALGAGHVALNYQRHASLIPNDPDYSMQWHLPQINAPTAWSTTTGSKSVVVATLDTGIDLTHPDLVANLWTNPFASASDGYNGTDVHGLNAITGDGSVNDDNGHGTHVAGILGAVGNNGVGVTGINWNVSIMALKFLDSTGSGYDSDAITCLDYAINLKQEGVNLIAINNSWGGTDSDPALEAAFNAASNAGILLPCAAGNGNSAGVGQDNDTTPTYPANFTSPTIISVAASDQKDNPASFTNYGAATVNLAAPGVDILSTYPSPLYQYDTGTSMATPMVTGAAALIEAANPGFTAAQIKSRILATVDVLPQWSGLSTTGGRLDVARAVNGSIYAISGNVYEVLPNFPHFNLVGASILLNGTQVSSSASDGTFAITNLAAGTYTVSVKLAGFNFATSSYSVTLPATTGTTIPNASVNFVGTSTGTLYAVQGYAYGLNGQPEAGIDIYTNALPNPVAVTNSSGYWVMWQRAAGQYWIGGSGGGVNWVAEPAFVNVPANANSSGVATINLYAQAPDTTPPSVTITTPATGSTISTGAVTATGTATDPSGVALIRLIIANETTATPSFWDWVNQDWTEDSTSDNIIDNLPQSGAVNVNWSTPLPNLTSGTYELDVWGRDTLGNESNGAQDAFSTFAVSATVTAARISIGNTSVLAAPGGPAVNAVFPVSLSTALQVPVTVNYATGNGTGKAGTDYVATSGTLTIPAGSTTGTISIPVASGKTDASGLTFTVTISSPVNAAIVTPTGTATITHDATPVCVSVVPSSPTSLVNTPELLTATYSSAGGVSNLASVGLNIGKLNSPATSVYGKYVPSTGLFYLANASGTYAGGFSAGSSNTITTSMGTLNLASTTVSTSGNSLIIGWNFTPNSTFLGPQNLYLVATDDFGLTSGWQNLGIWSIFSANSTNSASIDNTSVLVGASGSQHASFTVTLNAAAQAAVSLNYATANGTATAGTDYTATSGTLVIPAGGTTATINVPVANGQTDASGLTFTVTLSSPVNATITTATGTATIIHDAGPVAVSVNPKPASSAVSSPELLTATYNSAAGVSTLSSVAINIGHLSTPATSIYAKYVPSTGLFYVANAAGTYTGGFAAGSANTITTSMGTLNLAATTVSQTANQLTIGWDFTPTSTLIGTQNVYLIAADNYGLSSGWVNLGTWTITSSTPGALGGSSATLEASKPSGHSS